jgi:hypothetical protein
MEINEKILHPIDFEYNHKGNEFLNLVCVAVDNKRFWLDNNEELEDFKTYMKSIEGDILVCHAASLAEIPCCIKAGLEVDKFTWFDTFVTERRLRSFNGKADSSLSLIEVLKSYDIDYGYTSQEKEDLRAIIIDGSNIEYKRFEILDYCAEDIEHLKQLALKQIEKLEHQLNLDKLIDVSTCSSTKVGTDELIAKFIVQQSKCNVTTAKMYFEPFDVDYNKIKQLSDPRLVGLLKQNLNTLIPGLYDEFGTKKDDVVRKFITDEDSTAYDWFKYRGYLTPSDNKISLKDDFLNEYLSEHKGLSDKLDTFRQINKVIKACSGFQKEGEGNWITPNLFKDGMHCNASEFGTVTSRYTPKPSKGWVPGMGKALRGLLKPNDKNEAYFALDFNAQEIWVIGQLSKDVKLLDTYSSNDIYMSVAQKMGLYPADLKIPTEAERSEDWFKPYKPLRQKIKGMVLGLNYGMSEFSLAERSNMTQVEAVEMVANYNKTYFKKFDWTETVVNYFENHLTLLAQRDVCMKHWNYKEGKSRNKRQAMNFPVQCLGATITRRALELALEKGLKPIFPVHDEIYFKTTLDKLDADVACARKCMIEAAFDAVGSGALRDYPIKVGEVEVTTWNKVPQHSGGEATADLIERNLLLLKTLPGSYAPFKTKKTKQRSKAEGSKAELEGNSNLEDFFV